MTGYREIALLRTVSYRLVEVQELVHHGTVVHMVGDGAEAVVLRHGGEIVLAVVLPQCFVVPHDALLHIASVQTGLVH